MVTTKLNLSMTEPQVRQIYAKQGDTGRVLDISLDQTPEDGTLRILRPDGVEVTSEAVTGGEVESGGTFESLTEADVTELTVGIEPVQDLNGYDKPWVGGAGKNLASAVTYNNPTARYSPAITATYTLKSGKRYMFSFVTQNTGKKVYRQSTSTLGITSASAYDFTCDGTRKSFYGTASADATMSNESIILKSENDSDAVGLCSDFMVEEVADTVTTPTAYEPYENICPITGRTAVSIDRTGKNLLKLVQGGTDNGVTCTLNSDGTVNVSGTATSTAINVWFWGGYGTTAKIIRMYAGETVTVTDAIVFFHYDGGSLQGFGGDNSLEITGSNTFTFTEDGWIDGIRCPKATIGREYNKTIYPQLEVGSVSTDFHPYQGETYSISLGQTVYGGTLDMVTGVLTVDRAIVDLGTLSWSKGNRNTADTGYVFFSTSIASTISRDVTAIAYCSAYAQQLPRRVSWEALDEGQFQVEPSGYLVFVADYSDAPTFKTALNGVQLVYKLASPQTIQLTAQQIKTLIGTNNVWASSGDIISIKFTYGGLLSELPSDATSIVGKCYCDVEQNGVSSMPFTLNVKKNERAT